MDGFNRIDMFDYEGNLVKSIVTGDSDPIIKKDKLTVDGALIPYMSHYMQITSTPKYIFALYFGQNYMEIGEVKIDPVINVFSWNGKLQCQLMFSDYLSQFAVDTENFLIYGIDRYPDRILKYDIRDIFSSLPPFPSVRFVDTPLNGICGKTSRLGKNAFFKNYSRKMIFIKTI